MTRRYPLSYALEVEDPPLTAEELLATDRGGCDAVLLASIVYPPDGSLSILIHALDGRTKVSMTDKEIFKCWALMAKRLAASKTLDDGRREFAALTWEAFIKGLAGAKG